MKSQQSGWRGAASALIAKAGCLGLVGIALLVAEKFPGRHEQTRPCPVTLDRRLRAQDANLYLDLANRGYRQGDVTSPFYPLWPGVIRAAAPLFGGSLMGAGLVLSNVFSLLAWALFYRGMARQWGERAALWALIFLVSFPGSIFFQLIYTESLFLLLTMGLWLALQGRRYAWAAVWAGLLPLCRGVGAFAVVPLGWHAFRVASPAWLRDVWARRRAAVASGSSFDTARARQSGGKGRGVSPYGSTNGACHAGVANDRRTGGSHEPRRSALAPWMLVATPAAGWALYLALMWHWTGNPFEGIEAQKRIGAHSIPNLWNVSKFVVGFFNPTDWHSFRGSLLDRCAFVLLLYTLPVLWRLDKGLLAWVFMLGIVPAMSGTFTSYIRFASCAFPMFIALGVVLSRREWRWWRYALLVVFVTLHAALVWRYVNLRWAG